MKKALSIALVFSLIISIAGCSKSSGFENDKKKWIATLEKCFDAKEMPEETKEKFLKHNMTNSNKYFKGSLYVTVTLKDIESMDFEDAKDEMDLSDGIENIFMFEKSEDGATIAVILREFADDEYAEDSYKEGKGVIKMLKDKTDKIVVNDGKLMCKLKRFNYYSYEEVNGKLSLSISFTGTTQDALYVEYCELLSEMKYTDMEEFLEDVSNEAEDEN